MGLQKNSRNSSPLYLMAQLNDKIGPINRGIVYEDTLDEWLKLRNFGEVTGGGTGLEENGEIDFCDIEIELNSEAFNETTFLEIIQQLEMLKAPKGSKLRIEKTAQEIHFGKLEGLGLYIPNSSFLEPPSEGYDLNVVYAEILKLLTIQPEADRSWGGKDETALYFYDESYERMHEAISAILQTYPLCEHAKLVQIA